MDDAAEGMDLQSNAEAPSRPSSKVAFTNAAIATSVVTTVDLGTINDNDIGVHDVQKQGDDTSKESKKKKELMFMRGVELVNLDDYNISDKRLQYDSEDTDEEEAPNWEEMDVDEGAPSSM